VPLQGGGTKSITVTLYGANAATPPGAPVIGTASQAGAAAISIAFGPPASWGTTGSGAAAGAGNPVAYTATCGAHSNTGSASPITVSGLTPGGTYACTVVATNSAGQQGPASATSNSVTLAATVPGAPSLTRLVPGDSSIKVFFTAPVSNGGATITGYTATCTAAGGGSSKSASGLESPLTVTGLVNGTSYNCTVHATNSAGNSTESTAKTAVAGRKPNIIPFLLLML
jgi:predicted phage tail protein